ncbi:MAG: hypothetical protein OHK0012_10990 [Synechococcales cyanobacterium]
MTMEMTQLTADDLALMGALLDLFAEAFADAATYTEKRPSADYLRRLLASDSFIALVAKTKSQVIGGLTAYELRKFEQERSEIYIYDLAVAESHRRQGVASALIRTLQTIAAVRGAYVIFVQADTDSDDEPAQALYARFGQREEVVHFDIPVANDRSGL